VFNDGESAVCDLYASGVWNNWLVDSGVLEDFKYANAI
jgi:hypothetical protein